MEDVLRQSELFEGLDDAHVEPILGLAQRQTLSPGDYLFILGENADRLYVVLSGNLESCFPLSLGGALKDVAVEAKPPGSALGWSALVKPYRFTASARASEPSEVASFHRKDLMAVLDEDPQLGRAFISRIAEVIGQRFLTIRALWARELQQLLESGMPAVSGDLRRPVAPTTER
jgi:CRP-like cAMP-binding protein